MRLSWGNERAKLPGWHITPQCHHRSRTAEGDGTAYINAQIAGDWLESQPPVGNGTNGYPRPRGAGCCPIKEEGTCPEATDRTQRAGTVATSCPALVKSSAISLGRFSSNLNRTACLSRQRHCAIPGQLGSVVKSCLHCLPGYRRIALDDVVYVQSICQVVQDDRYHNPCPRDASRTVADGRVRGYVVPPIHQFHLRKAMCQKAVTGHLLKGSAVDAGFGEGRHSIAIAGPLRHRPKQPGELGSRPGACVRPA